MVRRKATKPQIIHSSPTTGYHIHTSFLTDCCESESLYFPNFGGGRDGGWFGLRVWRLAIRKRGARFLGSLVEHPGGSIRKLGCNRAGEMQIHRLLRNRKVTVAKLAEEAGRRTGELVQGLDVVVIQDTTEISVNVTDAGRAGFGPIGRGGATRGVLAHAGLCVDKSGAVLGLVEAKVWTRTGGKRVAERSERSFTEKESYRWLETCETAKARLSGARSITVVSDAESDIYELFAGKPEGVELVVRSSRPRRLAGGEMLSHKLNQVPCCGMIERSIPAAPGRKERRAKLELRYAQVVLKRPDQLGADTASEITVSAVDVREVDAPEGILPVHWLIVTTYDTDSLQKAAETIDLYRGRFLIEQLFRTLKTAGFNIESLELSDPQAFIAFTGFALLASSIILQLVKARDGNSGQRLSHSFEADDKAVLMALSNKLGGKTEKQKNPHSPDDLAFAAWVMARLGGWNCYYGKPGPETIRHGLERYRAIKLGTEIAKNV